jgi:glyoxylase-like metal-dependent hydrolase (beta-lactamase superfamily II)
LDESIRRVMKLPPETRLFPGHGDATTLADEAAQNPYVIDAMSAR